MNCVFYTAIAPADEAGVMRFMKYNYLIIPCYLIVSIRLLISDHWWCLLVFTRNECYLNFKIISMKKFYYESRKCLSWLVFYVTNYVDAIIMYTWTIFRLNIKLKGEYYILCNIFVNLPREIINTASICI